MDDDELAIGRVRAGDREAFRLLVERHQSSVCATVRALMPRYSDWEDVAQEVFLAAFRHLATFDSSKGTFRAWLLAIARNQCRNVWKRPVANLPGTIPDGADHRTPALAAAESEWFERLDSGLSALPEEQRLVFVLVEMQGLSYREAAEIAGSNVGTVKSRLSRAKEWLREALRSSWDEGVLSGQSARLR
jgi:RNA polymerase sigma-70 factor (ECF subfamily)